MRRTLFAGNSFLVNWLKESNMEDVSLKARALIDMKTTLIEALRSDLADAVNKIYRRDVRIEELERQATEVVDAIKAVNVRGIPVINLDTRLGYAVQALKGTHHEVTKGTHIATAQSFRVTNL
jgi:methylthioribose-1-phosphate isomerase